jgi:hypothetical protein
LQISRTTETQIHVTLGKDLPRQAKPTRSTAKKTRKIHRTNSSSQRVTQKPRIKEPQRPHLFGTERHRIARIRIQRRGVCRARELTWVALLVELLHICNKSNQLNRSASREQINRSIRSPRNRPLSIKNFGEAGERNGAEGGGCVPVVSALIMPARRARRSRNTSSGVRCVPPPSISQCRGARVRVLGPGRGEMAARGSSGMWRNLVRAPCRVPIFSCASEDETGSSAGQATKKSRRANVERQTL